MRDTICWEVLLQERTLFPPPPSPSRAGTPFPPPPGLIRANLGINIGLHPHIVQLSTSCHSERVSHCQKFVLSIATQLVLTQPNPTLPHLQFNPTSTQSKITGSWVRLSSSFSLVPHFPQNRLKSYPLQTYRLFDTPCHLTLSHCYSCARD